jgi:hypothetical protein
MAVSLVAKVRDAAGELYGHAKARYAASDTLQKASRQAGQAAGRVTSRVRDLSGKAASSPTAGKIRDLSGKAASSPTAGKIRDLSGKAASSPTAGKIRDLSGKATAAVRDARARRPDHR